VCVCAATGWNPQNTRGTGHDPKLKASKPRRVYGCSSPQKSARRSPIDAANDHNANVNRYERTLGQVEIRGQRTPESRVYAKHVKKDRWGTRSDQEGKRRNHASTNSYSSSSGATCRLGRGVSSYKSSTSYSFFTSFSVSLVSKR